MTAVTGAPAEIGGKGMGDEYGYEKLGLFYLGREFAEEGSASPPLLMKSSSLTTHAALIGMTGSGKTGLGIALIEEAIMDDIPAIVIDPKGDMANLLLSFPELRAEDFRPWIDPDEAARKGQSPDDYAAAVAENWRNGLASWQQSGERIATLRAKTEMTIYTPGSSAGVPVSMLGSLSAPAAATQSDTDTLNNLVIGATTSLLTLVGVKADSAQSREHILLSSILIHCWRRGEDLSMERLIGAIVSPPFDMVGVFPLDTFFPQADRMQLAMSFNAIVASPTFAAWLEGEPLDIQRLLYTDGGRPRTAIFSIAHLGDGERMFFVTMLLGRFIDWMRRQSGTSSLRTMLYMDEIYGYFPPTANPPSKKPMLLLLKQARAFGCGVVLATQNPVDLDYKGLANIGSWFVGRLQTSQDQERVAEGIAGASDGRYTSGQVKGLLAGLKGRQFLLSSAHLEAPMLFETRWVMSYLRGPIAASDVRRLMAGRQQALTSPSPAAPVAEPIPSPSATGARPVLSPAIHQYYRLQSVVSDRVVLRPWLAAVGKIRFAGTAAGQEEIRTVRRRLPLDEQNRAFPWQEAGEMAFAFSDCLTMAPDGSEYLPLSSSLAALKNLDTVGKDFADHLYRSERLELLRVPSLKLVSLPGERPGDFRVRVQDMLRQKKDEAVEKLRAAYATRQKRLEEKLAAALYQLEKERLDVKARTTDTVLSIGAAVVGALFGRKVASVGSVSRAATSMRSAGRVVKEKAEVQRAEEKLVALQQEQQALYGEINTRLAEVAAGYTLESCAIETVNIRPKKADIYDVRVALVWEMASLPEQA